MFFQEAVQPGLPLLPARRAVGFPGRAVEGRVVDVLPLAQFGMLHAGGSELAGC